MKYKYVNDHILKEGEVLGNIPIDKFYNLKSSFITHKVQTGNEQPFFVCDYMDYDNSEKLKASDHISVPRYDSITGSREVLITTLETNTSCVGVDIDKEIYPIFSAKLVLYEGRTYIYLGIKKDGKTSHLLCSIVGEKNVIEYLNMRNELRSKGMNNLLNSGKIYVELGTLQDDHRGIFINPMEFLDPTNAFNTNTYGMGLLRGEVESLEEKYDIESDLCYGLVDDKVCLELTSNVKFKCGTANYRKYDIDSKCRFPIISNLTEEFAKYCDSMIEMK